MRIHTQNLYFQKMPARIRIYTAFWSIAVWICIACSHNIPDASEQISQRPLHHLPDGHFRNTDTLTEPIRDTMEIDSLVPTHRTVLHPLPIVRGKEEIWADSSAASATWIGHSTYYIRLRNFGILCDPIFSERASPVQLFFGPKRGSPPGRSLDSLPGVDLVLISHDHYDHLDYTSIRNIHKKWPHCLYAVPLKIAEILEGWGIPRAQIIELDWWESQELHAKGNALRLTCVPAHHTSRRGAFSSSRNSTLWGGWIVEFRSRKIWFAGDIAMGDGSYYKEIAQKFAPIDVSFLPIGSYKPSRYTRVHISPRQAVQLHLLVRSQKSFAMHWGTFSMVYERMDDPPKDLKRAKKEMDVPDSSFIVPALGEIHKLFDYSDLER